MPMTVSRIPFAHGGQEGDWNKIMMVEKMADWLI
jgi:hypothetical protein